MFENCFKINNLIDAMGRPNVISLGDYMVTVKYNVCTPFGKLLYEKEIVIHKHKTVAFYIQIDDKGFYLSGYNPEFQSEEVLTDVVDKLEALTGEQ